MKKLLAIAAVGEGGLGLVLLVYPPIVVRLLINAEIAGAGVVMSRVAGIALIALGLACWSGGDTESSASGAVRGMLTYSLLATFYLGYLGIGGEWTGALLWPAVVAHAVVTVLLARAWLDQRRSF